MSKLILIDGMAAVYRGYYAMSRSPRVNSKGFDTSASLGFIMSLYDLLRTQRPTHIAVAFDLQKPTFRHEIYPEYKAHRDPMPEAIQTNLPWINRIIEAFRIPTLTCEGFEADDVIGTISHKAEEAGIENIIMVSPDKDFAQLVTPAVRLYRYGRAGKPDTLLDCGGVCEKFGVGSPRQVIDLLGLWGDAVDNIPGIRGVGEKTAKKLIAQFGSIEEMVERRGEIQNEKLRKMVEEHAEDALFSKQLATIRLDAPIEFEEERLRINEPDLDLLRSICEELEFRQFARRVAADYPQFVTRQEPLTRPTGTKSQPTLFDAAPSLFDAAVQEKAEESVSLKTIDDEALRGIRGRNISLFIQGDRLCMATDADNVWEGSLERTNREMLSELLAAEDTTKLCFDLKGLKKEMRKRGIGIGGYVFDVQIVHYLVDAEMRHTLDYICAALLGSTPESAAGFAAALWRLYPLLASKLRDSSLQDIYDHMELPLVDVLIGMEDSGVRIDAGALADYAKELASERDGIEQKIYSLAGHVLNINSPRQLGALLYEELRITDRPPRTATKQYSTAEEALQKLADRHEVVPLILEHRSLSKLIGTYLEALPKLVSREDGRLHTMFNQTVTATGRLSSSNPNLQNIPVRTDRGKEIRKAFVAADEEHIVLAADYSQIELRIIASLSKDEHLLHAFNSGLDIHAATAARIYGVPIEEVSAERRRNAKSVNFGIVYGISAFGLAQQLSIPRKEAAALIDEYFAQYPNISRFIEECKAFAREHGYARTLLGRRRYLPDINSRNAAARSFAERNAVNMPIQGTSADMIKLAMVNISRRFEEEGLRTKMLLQVHDELVFDLYKPEEERVRSIVGKEMREALPLEGIVPEVSIGVGENWLDAH